MVHSSKQIHFRWDLLTSEGLTQKVGLQNLRPSAPTGRRMTGWWLSFNPSEKYESIGMMIIPKIWGKHAPNHQPE